MAPSPFVWFLRLFSFIALLAPALAQVSTVAGTAVYDGTPVTTNPNGAPTLVYNCAKLPAICSNVNRRNRLTNYGPGKYGPLIGNDHVVMHYDTDSTRKSERRDGPNGVCKSSWKSHHPCPETSQPNTVPGGSSYKNSYAPARYNPNNVGFGKSGYNRIADPQGGDSGMIWSCDEWPPAMYVYFYPRLSRSSNNLVQVDGRWYSRRSEYNLRSSECCL